MTIDVKGYRVLVKPKEVEKVSKGGIIVTVEGSQEEKLEKAGQQFGTVVDIGHTCWSTEELGDPWCKVGDRVLFAKYAGIIRKEGEDIYIILNDEDIIGVIE